MIVNPILLQVFRNRFVAIAEEMGVTLGRTAFSPNIKERRDYSCALFDANGDMIAQAAHIPVHLGSMPLSVKAAIAAIDMQAGDMVMLNDPFAGGTHLPDITLVAPVYVNESETPAFYVANRAHHSDVGGMSPGSMPVATSIFQEGLIIPPTLIVRNGEIDRNLFALLLRNVRTPQEREGDFAAQVMANLTGVERSKQLVEKYGLQQTCDYAGYLNDYAEKMLRQTISAIPDGEYRFEDYLDNDGISTDPVPLKLKVKITGDAAELDFRESARQVKGSVNAVYAITLSAVLYCFRCLIKEDVPTNAGIARPLNILTEPGTVVDARFPAAVAGGNVETSQRIVDLVLGALAQAIPEQIPAASQGTMNNTTIGGIDPRTDQPFSYYETLGGGCGATSLHDGADAVHSHMTNTLNTPIEALEYAYPFRVTCYGLRSGSGGAGKQRGGDGLIREIEMLTDTEVTVLTERRNGSPYGLNGGSNGQNGRNQKISATAERVPGKITCSFAAGEKLRIETPGGGGWGKK
ncbi:N-methylhydantoinase B [Malonomonas rubra DSM 5091]|uniref:N-methylhydantoinase B n=1 Tax=Malonomonas rubra DSM 5091 TaxID=1122189 RepID=A0A1M6E5F6_MALRU|nr:hydantoinase B/oxoprolinase family protein [Malonomonas rubra]SHI80508.1 N-methylhydantoinase B [Malonomonas rubra DSM 5091]